MSDAPRIEIERETITNLATGNATIKKTELKAVCALCKWCKETKLTSHISVYQCRKRSIGDNMEWPGVMANDWCGDWDGK